MFIFNQIEKNIKAKYPAVYEFSYISIDDYYPFDENSQLAVLESQSTFKITDDIPVMDGSKIYFPIYASFINAVYPADTFLYGKHFKFNDTSDGYKELALKSTDVFIGAFPSEQSYVSTLDSGTNLDFTIIGYDSMLFYVHKDNPIDNLTVEQIINIYSGETSNWSSCGGEDRTIDAYQRNDWSESQSSFKEYMNGMLMKPSLTETINYYGERTEIVSDYRNSLSAIGYSLGSLSDEVYLNDEVKVLCIDGVAPTEENIVNRSYPILVPIYAVTYIDNPNQNVTRLLDWILSEEGQALIIAAGYAPVY